MTEFVNPLVIGYDGSDHAKRAIVTAGELLAGRSVLVATVWTSFRPVGNMATLGVPSGVTAAALEKLDEEAITRAAETSAEGAEAARAAGLDATPMHLQAQGNVWATLVQLTVDAVSAVVVGSHGRSGLGEALLGSVTRGLVHHSEVPVLVVPPGR